jgi:hypothetical protein
MRGDSGFGHFSSSGGDYFNPETCKVTTRRESTNRFYTLADDGRLVPEPDPLKWTLWMHHSASRVAKFETVLGVEVSTVFTGVTTNDPQSGIWETAVRVPNEAWTSVHRYDTKDAALAGHAAMVQMIRGGRAIRLREDE